MMTSTVLLAGCTARDETDPHDVGEVGMDASVVEVGENGDTDDSRPDASKCAMFDTESACLEAGCGGFRRTFTATRDASGTCSNFGESGFCFAEVPGNSNIETGYVSDADPTHVIKLDDYGQLVGYSYCEEVFGSNLCDCDWP